MNIIENINDKRAALLACISEAKRELKELEAQKQRAQGKNGIEKWLGNEFESSSGITEEYMAWKRDYRKEMKKILGSEFEMLPKTSDAHFEASGFVKNISTGKLVYYCSSDIRYSRDAWYNNILIRTAQHDNDWSGGRNDFANWTNLKEKMLSLTE